MAFNYAMEKRRFDAEWKKLSAEYSAAGMDAADIQAMYDFDLARFNARRAYQSREQQLPQEGSGNGELENGSPLFRKFPTLTYQLEDEGFSGRFGWIDEIDNPALAGALTALTDNDKELLTLLAIDGYSQTDIARMRGCKPQAISKKVARLKKLLVGFRTGL